MHTQNTPVDEPLLETLEAVEAFEQTPCSEQFPYTDIYAMLQHSAERFGSEPAIEFLLTGEKDESAITISFVELFSKITQTANFLHGLGVSQDDAVSIILPTLPQSHPAIWGSQAAGISNTINPMLEANHIGEIIEAAQARVIICLAPSDHIDIWEKILQVTATSTSIHTVVVVRQPGLTNNALAQLSNTSINVFDFDKEIHKQPGDKLLSNRTFAAEQLAAYFHTGGTTGRPKIAQLTHGNLAYLGQLMQVYTAHWERHTVLCGLPLFHIYGVVIQGIAAFSVGYRVLLMTPSGFRNAQAMKNFWHHVERFKVKGVSAVPTVLSVLAQIPVADANIDSLTHINSGAAPLSQSFKELFEEKHDVEVSNGYGMTETTALISRAPANQPPGSVGMRIPYSQIRIAQLDGDTVVKDCAAGQSGVILVKGPQIFSGYKSDSDNAHAWVDGDWFNTGDLGYLGEDGFLYLSGRSKDLIIRGGHNIDPVTIEEPLDQHPAVATSVAIGQPDPHAGELPMAFVVLNQGAKCSQEELIQYCQANISERAATPKRIVIVDEMPLTAVGKIFKPALRQQITLTILTETLATEAIEAEVTTELHKQKGLVAKVRIARSQDLEKARELLNPFTFPINLT